MANHVHEEDVSSYKMGTHRRVLGGLSRGIHWTNWQYCGDRGENRIGL